MKEIEVIEVNPEIIVIDELKDFEYLFSRVNVGISVYPSEIESEKLYEIAKKISPNQDFIYKGCQDCLNHLVKYVYDNQNLINATKKKSAPQE